MKRDRKTEVATAHAIDRNHSKLVGDILPRGHVLDMLLSLADIIASYGLGIYIGMIVGAVIGKYVAGHHAEDLRHTIDFFDPDQLKHWSQLCWTYGRAGAKIGALVSIPVMKIVQSMFFKTEVASLCNGEVVDPVYVARVFGRSVRKVRKTMNRLAKKGIIEQQTAVSQPSQPSWTETAVSKGNSFETDTMLAAC